MTNDPQTATPVDAPETAEYVRPEEAEWEDDRWDDDPAASVTPPRPRRRLITPASIVLAGVVVAGVGFIGGVQVQKRASADERAGGGLAAIRGVGGPGGLAGGAPGAGAAGAAGAGAARGGGASGAASGGTAAGGGAAGAGSGASGAAGAAGGTTVGEVVNVKGSTLYVSGADGTTVEVRVGSRATVQRLAKTTAKQVRPGDSVIVQGTTRSDGGVSATTVQAMASGLTLSFGGLGGLGGGGTGRSGGAAAPSGSGAAASGSGGGSSSSGSSGSGASSSGGGSGSSDVDQLFGGG